MRKIFILSTIISVLASGILVSCETPESDNKQEVKREMGDGEGNIPVKPRPPVIPPVDPKK